MAKNFGVKKEGIDSDKEAGTVALKTTINDVDISLPTISPQGAELKRAKKRNMVINSKLATHVERVKSVNSLIADYNISKSRYEEFARSHSKKIVNFSLDLPTSEKLDMHAIWVIRKIQINANSPFLFEYEKDDEQSVNSQKNQLKDAQRWIGNEGSSKILVPVIDIKIKKDELFREKLEELSKTYSRINVRYRTPNKYLSNWSYLKAFLKENNIWCHMDCVWHRYDAEKIAHRVRLYSIGISSTSLGYPLAGSSNKRKQKKMYKFNTAVHKYEAVYPPHIPSFAEKSDRIWIESLNDEISELQKMRDSVIRKNLYSTYLPMKSTNYLTFTKGI